MNTRDNRHAVVLGGSFAGLLATRVLVDHFERVTLIERDAYPETTAPRKGLPQANHVHGMLARRLGLRRRRLCFQSGVWTRHDDCCAGRSGVEAVLARGEWQSEQPIATFSKANRQNKRCAVAVSDW